MGKVGFRHVEADGRYQTQDPAGSEVIVEGGKTYSTQDPHVIAELDACEHVRRVKSSAKDEEG